jgi:hypothetical protein
LERYFSDEEDRLLNLLNRVLPSRGPPLVAPSTVRGKYVRVFAILLRIGKGRFIDYFVRHLGLSDNHLPFLQRPPDFPTSPDFFNEFYERQWMFCPQTLEYSRSVIFPPRMVLPILAKEKIGAGGDAIVHKIVVHSAYNKLRATSLVILSEFRAKSPRS